MTVSSSPDDTARTARPVSATPGAAASPRRWVAVGRSAQPDSATAGAAAVAEALAGRPDARLLILFCSIAHDLEALLRGVAEEAPGVPLIGCSTAGEIATDGPGDAGVVVFALGGQGFFVTTGAAGVASTRLRDAGAEAAQCAVAQDGYPHQVLLMLTDGLAGDQQEIVRGAYSVVGAAVPLVGGCAGDDLHMQRTFQLHDGAVLEDSVVAAHISSDSPLGVGVRHGWRKVGQPMLVTRSGSNRVHTLDDRPALDAYFDVLDVPLEARTDPDAFTRFALTHPFGLNRRSGEEQVRFIGGADFDDRSIATIAEVPQGGLVWLMAGDADSVHDATNAACADALTMLGDVHPLGALTFDCIARRGVLGEAGIHREVQTIADIMSGSPVAGFYTYGEIARTQGVAGFHNQTLVVLAMS